MQKKSKTKRRQFVSMEVTEATANMQGSAEPKARQGLDLEI